MKLPFGLVLTRQKAAVSAMSPADMGYSGTWQPLIRDPFTGAWQRNLELTQTDLLSYSTVFACITLIASDISKMALNLVTLAQGVWQEDTNSAYSPVLDKPNHFQTHLQFFEYWMNSKLCHGNTYVKKVRDSRGVVSDLYILNPQRVKTLVAPNGDVYYDINADPLALQPSQEVLPATEIIHDRFNCFYHQLIGLSPLSACGLAATQGVKIQQNSAQFFNNNSNPGGILTAPHAIPQDVAERIKQHWEANYSGAQNVGKVAVLGDGLKYEPMMITARDAELVNQLKLSAEMVCQAFHVPPYMVNVGPPPNYNNAQALIQLYYGQCLQVLIEAIEKLIREGLSMGSVTGVRFDLEALMRMDTLSATEAATKAIAGGLKKPNEARRIFDLPPVEGGDDVFLQRQCWPLDLLGSDVPPPTPAPAPPPAKGLSLVELQTKAAEWFEEEAA